jgi:hypothetical protein
MLKCISVYDRDGKLLNEFQINFLQRKLSEFKLDPKTFYLEYGKIIPENNIEMMVEESAPFTIPSLVDANTHIHKGNDGQQYICYPRQIESVGVAIQFAKNWCLLTTFHLTQKADVAWFESFGNWMIKKTQAYQDPPNSFQEFTLWIQNGSLGWKVEIS